MLIFGCIAVTILQTKNGLKLLLTKNLCNRSQKRTLDVYLK